MSLLNFMAKMIQQVCFKLCAIALSFNSLILCTMDFKRLKLLFIILLYFTGQVPLKASKNHSMNKFERNQMDEFDFEAVDIGDLTKIKYGRC